MLTLSVAVGACASPATPTTPPLAASATPTATLAPSPSPSLTPTPAPAPAAASVEVIVRGLEAPWAVDFAPDGRAFLTERVGRIRIIRDGALAPEPWATLPAAAVPDREMGLLGLALDPGFSRTGFVYAYYTYRNASGQLRNRLVRLRDDAGRGILDRLLIDDMPGGENHDGGRLKFGPDGKLYLTVGDTERGQLAQDLAALAGKVLRLERDGAAPSDNPFAGSLVYSFGHRNPQGLAWHPEGGLYETEHGPSGNPARGQPCCHDEVNRIEAGANYGWPAVFGVVGDKRFLDPVHESGNDTWAPSGAAFITRGPLRGSFLFAALSGQHLHRLVFSADGRAVSFEERLLQNQFGRLRDVVEAPDGSLWVLTSNRDGRARPARDDDRVLRVVLR